MFWGSGFEGRLKGLAGIFCWILSNHSSFWLDFQKLLTAALNALFFHYLCSSNSPSSTQSLKKGADIKGGFTSHLSYMPNYNTGATPRFFFSFERRNTGAAQGTTKPAVLTWEDVTMSAYQVEYGSVPDEGMDVT